MRQTKAVESPAPAGAGVYLLFRGRQLTYVGRSTYPPSRIDSHRVNGRPFDRSAIIWCSEEDSYWMEKALITALQPPQNRAGVMTPLEHIDPTPPAILERIVIREAPPRPEWKPIEQETITLAKAKDIASIHMLQRRFSKAIEAGDVRVSPLNPEITGKGARRVVERSDLMAWIEKQKAIRGRAYQTRHTFATLLLMGGVNPTYIAKQLGHANTGMLFKVYGTWIEGADRGAEAAKANLLLGQSSTNCPRKEGQP